MYKSIKVWLGLTTLTSYACYIYLFTQINISVTLILVTSLLIDTYLRYLNDKRTAEKYMEMLINGLNTEAICNVGDSDGQPKMAGEGRGPKEC